MIDRTAIAAGASPLGARVRLLLGAALFALLPVAGATQMAAPLAADPALERRVMAVAEGLRCLVCQNQSLADSNAELAVDLRNEMREQMRRGATDADVIAFLVARYGDFVLYRPPLKANTVLLWSGPALLLLAGVGLVARTVRRRRGDGAPPLDAQARARARAMLGPAGQEGLS